MNKLGYKKVKELQDSKLNINESIIYNCIFGKENIKNIKSLSFDDCEFHNCKFEGTIDFCTFTNCLFLNCDLSNCIIKESGFHFVTIKDSKMLGIAFGDSLIKNTEFNSNLSNLTIFSDIKFNNFYLTKNNMESTSFISCDFKNINMTENNLSDSEFLNTNLKDIDLSTNDISKIKINLENIKGAIIDSLQVYDLINLLNIKIK